MHPFRIKDSVVKEAEEQTRLRELARTQNLFGEYTSMEVTIRENQTEYLRVFEKTFSPVIAQRFAGITRKQLLDWKHNFYDFAVRYNEIVDMHVEQLLGSVMQRAMGMYTEAPKEFPTDSGFVEDAAGNPVVVGGNDKLAIKVLEAAYPEQFGTKKTVVTTNVKPFHVHLTPESEDEPEEEGLNDD